MSFYINYRKNQISELLNKQNEVQQRIDNTEDNEEKEKLYLKKQQILPSAKSLTMINTTKCDFCNNESNEETKFEMLTPHYGFQICQNCRLECKHKSAMMYDCIKHKHISWELLWSEIPEYIDKIPSYLNPIKLIVEEDNELINGWESNHFLLINCEEELFSLINSDKTLEKGIYLNNLCNYNPSLNYNLIKSTIDEYMKPII